ncbi:hypothetical protein Ntsu_09330 [Nocardia sp. IFM 10818]
MSTLAADFGHGPSPGHISTAAESHTHITKAARKTTTINAVETAAGTHQSRFDSRATKLEFDTGGSESQSDQLLTVP